MRETDIRSGARSARAEVVLLGDSIFANAAYTRGAPDVVTHLRALLPPGFDATLAAVDGARTSDVAAQLSRLSADARYLVVSIGGNDALQNADLLTQRVPSVAAAMVALAPRLGMFERSYSAALDAILAHGLPTTVCTIYNGALEPGEGTPARLALTLFNDVILRAAIERQVNVIELRAVCTDREDYANPIEPSDRGGRKIAAAIARAIGITPAAEPSRVSR